jgi:hypothetical protein
VLLRLQIKQKEDPVSEPDRKKEKIILSQAEYEHLWHKKDKTDEEKRILEQFETDGGGASWSDSIIA